MSESKEILLFLRNFKGSLSPDEYHFLSTARLHALQMEEEKVINSIYGSHFQSCPSSDDNYTQGFNECTCFANKFILSKARTLMEKYKKF